MLEFLRKYQRFFFLLITAVVIASFSFFGTFSLITNDVAPEDPVIGEAVDGSPIHLSEVRRLSRFLAADREDGNNLCNDGVVRNDLLRTGVADLLVASSFDPLKEGLDHRLERIRRYRPYVHPQVPTLSAKSVWERYLPTLVQGLDALQAQEAVDSTTFATLSRLYLQQSFCPPEFLRRVLLYQERSLTQREDQNLRYTDLSLFGFHTLSDWFGPDFIDLSSAFILNGARAAEQKGFRVSLEEAQVDLVRNFQQSLKQLNQKTDLTLQHHLQALGFDEKSAAKTWRTVLLFRRYFQAAGDATFVDRLPYRQFASYALEKAMIQLYQLPASLRLKTPQDRIALQGYLKAVSKEADLKSPVLSYLSLDEIEKTAPELIQTTYRAKVAAVSKEQVGLKATTKEVIEWQVEDKNWETLRSQFSFLPKASLKEERLQILETLENAQRLAMDQSARLQWVDLHPDQIDVCLDEARTEEKTLSISKGDARGPLFAKVLEGDIEAQKSLHRYSADGKTFSRIEGLERSAPRHLLTLEEAKTSGAMEKVTSRFKIDKGDFNHRLEDFAKAALVALQKNPEDPQWISIGGNPLLDQFKFDKQPKTVQRTEQEEWMNQAFLMDPNQWSSVHVPENGEIAFFFFEKKEPHQEPIMQQMVFGKETIAADAQRFLAKTFLEILKNKHALVLPLQKEAK